MVKYGIPGFKSLILTRHQHTCAPEACHYANAQRKLTIVILQSSTGVYG